MKKVIILIDGPNLFDLLRNLQLPAVAIFWRKLFYHLLEPGNELLRASLFRPERVQDTNYGREEIRSQVIARCFPWYSPAYLQGSIDRIPFEIQEEIAQKCEEIECWIKDKRGVFSEDEYYYDRLCREQTDLEITRKGIIKIDPYTREYGREKGVDLALAMEMVSLSGKKQCDKIILISGDYDYREVINTIRKNGIKIHLVKFHKDLPERNRYAARDLSLMADKVINLYESEIRSGFLRQ